MARDAPGNVSALAYMPQLDGLRAIAVLAVIYTHYAPKELWLLGVYWGGLGVNLFFVLSGFLITQLLWMARARIEAGERARRQELGRFLLRRLLRLAPALWAALAVAALLDLGPVRETIFWHLAYLSNFYFLLRGDWNGSVSHLWSLAAEEQFYLLWSLVVLFTPRRWALATILAAVAVGPLFRALTQALSWPEMVSWVMVPSNFDLLGGGALLAWLVRADAPAGQRRRVRLALAACGALGALVWAAGPSLTTSDSLAGTWAIVGTSCMAAVFVWLVGRAADGFGGAAGRLLAAGPLVALGRISYCVYLVHLFPLDLFDRFLTVEDEPRLWLRPAFGFVVTLAWAALSWRYVERPANALKNRLA